MTTDVDVLVIGAGACGLAAAIAAHDRGMSAAILEKMDRPGGNSALSTGSVPAAASRFQREAGIDDDPDRFFKDLMSIGQKSEKWDALDADLGSFARMAAAAEVGCSFCLDFNYFLAHDRGLDEERAREVPRWRESSVFTPLERQVMEYAEAMCQTPPTVTDELSDALLAELGPAALLELAAKVSLMNATARMNIALGIHSEQFADACGLPPLAARSTVASAA